MKTFRLFVAFTLVCFTLSPNARGVVPPPPGGYPNFTTAAGDHALQALTLGLGNTALGTFSLFSVTSGSFNTAVGAGALDLNTADSNTATGAAALLFNTTGTENTAHGTAALEFNDIGSNNTAIGAFALFSNTHGGQNTGIGSGALQNNNNFDNTAVGYHALFSNTTGVSSTAVGEGALSDNTTGSFNTAIGADALQMSTDDMENVAIGTAALVNHTAGNSNIAVGESAGLINGTGSNNIFIGNAGSDGNESNSIHIGTDQLRAFIAGIRGATTGNNNAIPVLIDSAGQLGTMSSSRRFKTEIKPIDKASESILALKPVSFRYKVHKDTTPQFGLIAEEVAGVNPDLVIYDADGKPYTVRYDAVNAMLLNEFLKEHSEVQELKTTVVQQQKQIEALTAGLQRVNTQLELNKLAPQTVKNTD